MGFKPLEFADEFRRTILRNPAVTDQYDTVHLVPLVNNYTWFRSTSSFGFAWLHEEYLTLPQPLGRQAPTLIAPKHLGQKSIALVSPVETDFLTQQTTADADTYWQNLGHLKRQNIGLIVSAIEEDRVGRGVYPWMTYMCLYQP